MPVASSSFSKTILIVLCVFVLQNVTGKEIHFETLSPPQRVELIEQFLVHGSDRVRLQHDARMEYAHQALENAIILDNELLVARARLLLAELHYQKGEFVQASQLLNQVLTFAGESNNIELENRSLNVLGNIARQYGDFYEALESIFTAYRLIDNDETLSHLIPASANNLGVIYRHLGDYELARRYYTEAQEYATLHSDTHNLIHAYTNIGNLFRAEKNMELAYAQYNKGMELARQTRDVYHLASLNNNIGNTFRDQGDAEEAFSHYYKALSFLDESYLAGLRAVVYRNIGRTYIMQQNPQQALSYIKKSLDITEEINIKRFTRDNYLTLAQIIYGQGDVEKAYTYLEKYVDLSQELYNNQLINSIAYFNERYSEAIFQEGLLRFRLERNLLILMITVLALVFLITTSLLIFRNNKNKKRYIQRLQEIIVDKEITEKALIQSKENYQTLIKTLNEGLIVLDLENKIEFLNFKACKVLGVEDKNEVLGKNFQRFLLTNEDEKLFLDKMELQKMGISDHYEVKMKNMAEDVMWVNLSSAPILDENLKSKGTVTLITDVSERKKSEQTYNELTSSLNQKIKQLNCLYDISDLSGVPGITFEEIIEKALEIIPVGLKYTHDIGVQIMFDNKVYSSPDFKDTPWSYIVPIKAQKKKLGYLKVVYLEEKPNINKDPFHFNEKILLKNISEKFGQIIESRQLYNVLSENQARLEEVQRIARIGNWEKELTSGTCSFSDNFFDIIDVIPEKKSFFDYSKLLEMIHPEDLGIFRKLEEVAQNKNEKPLMSGYYRIITRQGIVKNIFSSRKISYDEGNVALRCVYTVQDVTGEMFQHNFRHNIELALKTTSARQEVLSRTSHKLHDPVWEINAMVDHLLKTRLNKTQKELVQNLYNSCKDVSQIVSNMEELSGQEKNKLQSSDQSFDMFKMLERLQDFFGALTRHKKVSLKLNADKSIPRIIHTDENHLHEVLSNLLSNAVRHTDSGEVVLNVSCEAVSADTITLGFEVIDQGALQDISKPNDKLKPFDYIDESFLRSRDESGLAFTMSQKIVELLGGSIVVRKTRNKGNSYSFKIVARTVASENDAISSYDIISVKNRKYLEGARILCIDDSIIDQKVVALMLSQAKASAVFANTGQEAIKLLEKESYDAILLDLVMPSMDGIDTMKAIKTQVRDYPPVIALSGSITEDNKQLCLANGMVELISKPVDAPVLYNKLAYWIEKEKTELTKNVLKKQG